MLVPRSTTTGSGRMVSMINSPSVSCDRSPRRIGIMRCVYSLGGIRKDQSYGPPTILGYSRGNTYVNTTAQCSLKEDSVAASEAATQDGGHGKDTDKNRIQLLEKTILLQKRRNALQKQLSDEYKRQRDLLSLHLLHLNSIIETKEASVLLGEELCKAFSKLVPRLIRDVGRSMLAMEIDPGGTNEHLPPRDWMKTYKMLKVEHHPTLARYSNEALDCLGSNHTSKLMGEANKAAHNIPKNTSCIMQLLITEVIMQMRDPSERLGAEELVARFFDWKKPMALIAVELRKRIKSKCKFRLKKQYCSGLMTSNTKDSP